MDLYSYQLGQFAIKGLLVKTGIDPKIVDSVIMGTVVHNVKMPNVASGYQRLFSTHSSNYKI